MIFIQFSIFVNADPAEVFNVVSDPRSKLAWVPVRRVELETPGIDVYTRLPGWEPGAPGEFSSRT